MRGSLPWSGCGQLGQAAGAGGRCGAPGAPRGPGGRCGLREGAPFPSLLPGPRVEGPGGGVGWGGAGGCEAGQPRGVPAFVKHHGRGPRRTRGRGPTVAGEGGGPQAPGGADAGRSPPG